MHCEWEKHEFSFIRNFVFLTVIKVTHIISSSKSRVDKFIRQVMIQFYGCPRAIVSSYTGNYGHKRQVNRKSPERTEDDLPVPLIPSADKTR